jgi:hypothetical protein
MQRVAPVGGAQHVVAKLAEPAGDELGGFEIILGEEDLQRAARSFPA